MRNLYQNPDLNIAKKAFDKAVGIRQWSMIREKIVPRIMPPLAVASVFTTSLFLDVWSHLPPQGRLIGVLAFAATTLASPFIRNQAGSPIVTRKDAIRAIDRDIGDQKILPAHDFNDRLEGNTTHPLWEAGKFQIWNNWKEKIINQKRLTGFGAYYGKENTARTSTHIAIVCATALSASFYGDNLRKNWQTAMDWTVPIPPLVYTASIVPPAAISSLNILTDRHIKAAIADGAPLQAHEQSIMTITAQDRPAIITINGDTAQPLEPQKVEEQSREQFYIYEILLDDSIHSIQIEGEALPLSISADATPSVDITAASPDRDMPTSLRLDYTITDDTGAKEATGSLGILSTDGKRIVPVLDSNKLPNIILPYE